VTHKVVFRDEANADLTALYDYIADESGPTVAIAYVRRIRDACMALEHFPERGTKRDDIIKGLRTIGFERRVTIGSAS
jgi:toxin ParE1/3/4